MRNFISKTVSFILFYLIFLAPTYILPYFGSNSVIMDSAAKAGGYEGLNVGFYFHVFCPLFLVYIAWARTSRLTKNYLFAFPIIALGFDMIPVLSSIPFIPSIMHMLTLILGITLAKQEG